MRAESDLTDGPFTEAKEVIGGYWLIQVASRDEATTWARRAPCPEGEMIELRQVFEPADFGPEIAEKEASMVDEIARNTAQNRRDA